MTQGVCTDSPGARMTSPGKQQLTAREERLAGRDPLGRDAVISTPRDMDAVHPPALEAESRSAGREEERRVGARSASAALADMGPEREGAPLRRALAQVATGGVEQLRRVPRHREERLQRLHGIPRRAGVANEDALVKETAGAHTQLDLGGELRLRVDERDRRAVVIGLSAGEFESHAGTGPVSMALDAGRAEPTACLGGDEARRGASRRVRRRRVAGEQRQRGRRVSQVSRRGAPHPSGRSPGGAPLPCQGRRSCRPDEDADVLIGCSATTVLWVRSSPIAPLRFATHYFYNGNNHSSRGLSSLCWPCS